MKDAKLNNLLGMEQYSEADFTKKAKTTKRTDVAKDVLQENAYVVGKEVFKGNPKVEMPTGKGETVKVVGKEVLGDHLKNKETHAAKGLNNLISLDDFTKSVPTTKDSPTKRTGTAKDVLQEKVKTKKVTPVITSSNIESSEKIVEETKEAEELPIDKLAKGWSKTFSSEDSFSFPWKK